MWSTSDTLPDNINNNGVSSAINNDAFQPNTTAGPCGVSKQAPLGAKPGVVSKAIITLQQGISTMSVAVEKNDYPSGESKWARD